MNHIDTISHLAERESARTPRLGTAIDLHYESLLRTSLDARTRNSDPEIKGISKVELMLLQIDDHLLEVARSRIG